MPRVRKDKKFPDVFVEDYLFGIKCGDRCKVLHSSNGCYIVLVERKPHHAQDELQECYQYNLDGLGFYGVGCIRERVRRGAKLCQG